MRDQTNKRVQINLASLPQPTDDPRAVFERLRDYSARGIDAPESLSLAEIRQVSFALSLYLISDEEKQRRGRNLRYPR